MTGIRLIHGMVRKDSNLPLLAFLLKCNCDINISTLQLQYSPVVISIRRNQTETLKFLIQNGADVNKERDACKFENQMAPLDVALEGKSHGIIKILLSAKDIDLNQRVFMGVGRKEPLLLKCVMFHPEYIEKLLEAGADPNVQGEWVTPLMASTALNNIDMMKLLIRYGADPNCLDRRIRGYHRVPLLHSVLSGKVTFSFAVLQTII